MTGPSRCVGILSAALFASGCSDRVVTTTDAGVDGSVDAGVDAAPPILPTPLASGDPRKAPSTTYEDETSTRPMELLKFQFTSAIKSRQPVDKMVLAKPGDRVYGYLTLRNRSGRARKVHLEFAVNGEKRTEMDLDVADSWSYRTWGYNTILPKDKPGKLTLVATDDEDHPLFSESLPIIKK